MYTPAVTPGLRKLLVIVFVLFAALGANSCYLATVTVMEAWTGEVLQNYFYQVMFLLHLVMGLALVLPFFLFAILHMRNTLRRKNRRAVWMGLSLFVVSSLLLVSGLLLMRVGSFDLKTPIVRQIVYWLHVVCPLLAIWLYCLHRLAGPPIRWRLGIGYGLTVALLTLALVSLRNSDPRQWNQVGSAEGDKYFQPSLARTTTGKFIPAHALSNDQYCKECHPDVHAGWLASAHRFSSFNNPAYLVSVRETREFSLQREGSVRRSRWCAGCHDPVPFFSGRFDDPNFDDVADPTAHAGITCTVCHVISNVNSPRGNADYTIDAPAHYPFTFSDNRFLQWLNRQLVQAKPSFHKKTFLKPFHRTTEFCSVCHKVHLPEALNDYKFLRGQNHYDSFLLSGVSGHGARSFYYPEVAETNCNRCHMPAIPSDDFSAHRFAGTTEPSVHDHLFVGANTALPFWNGFPEALAAHQEFLADCMRVDIFGVRQGNDIESPLIAPVRPEVPSLTPGGKYVFEVVLRTLKLGHHFTQGTVDSNEVWLDVVVRSGDRIIGRSGQLDESGHVNPWSHFVNVFMLDRNGNRIDRRNAQDIFVPLYNHQIPPGAGQTVHYGLELPESLTESITVEVALRYRKFDQTYMEIVAARQLERDKPLPGTSPNGTYRGELPITTLAEDSVVFPLAPQDGKQTDGAAQQVSNIPPWMRWNDYGIGLLLKGKAELRQAAAAFAEVEKLGRYDGPLNLARVLYREGRLDEAVDAVRRAAQYDDPAAPPWTVAWLSGLINREQGYLDEAERNFRSVLQAPDEAMRARGLDFRRDYEVINLLGQTLFDQARRLRGQRNQEHRDALLRQAIEQFERALQLDPENATAHFGLQQIHAQLGDAEASQRHRDLHLKYKPDDNARDRAVAAARKKYPAANKAAEAVVIYDLGESR